MLCASDTIRLVRETGCTDVGVPRANAVAQAIAWINRLSSYDRAGQFADLLDDDLPLRLGDDLERDRQTAQVAVRVDGVSPVNTLNDSELLRTLSTEASAVRPDPSKGSVLLVGPDTARAKRLQDALRQLGLSLTEATSAAYHDLAPDRSLA
jgi:hypothetical protein